MHATLLPDAAHRRVGRPLPKDPKQRATAAQRDQLPVGPRWAGDSITSSRELTRALGKGAWRLWTALLTFRDGEGLTTVTTRRLEQAAQLNALGVKRALRRLRSAHLVRDIGQIYALVPCHRCPDSDVPHHHEVYQRVVYGSLAEPEAALAQPRARVPRATVEWCAKAPGKGGKRAGAGRPEGISETAPRAPKRRLIKRYPVESKGTPDKNLLVLSEPESYRSLVLGKNAASEDAASFSDKKSRGRKASAPSATLTPVQIAVLVAAGKLPRRALDPVQETPAVSEAPTTTGPAPSDDGEGYWFDQPDALKGGGRPQRYTSDDVRAATDLSNAIPTLTMPPPPRLDPHGTPEETLATLSRAYSAAHEKMRGSRPYLRRQKPLSEKARKARLEAAEALREVEINPTAWAVFALKVWTETMKKAGAPEQGWVWDAARIRKHAGWCHGLVGNVNTGSTVYTPAFRELIRRLHRLRAALGYGRPTNEVVAEVLPDSERRSLLARAHAEIAAAQVEITQRIRAGEWVWC